MSCQKKHHLSFSFLSLFRQCQQLPLWTRRAQMGSLIRKLCRGNVASGSACRTSLGRLLLQPMKGHVCPRRWYSAATTFEWSLCSSQMACSSPMEVTEDYPENFISISTIGSPLCDSINHKNFFPPPSYLPCLPVFILQL